MHLHYKYIQYIYEISYISHVHMDVDGRGGQERGQEEENVCQRAKGIK